MSFGWAEQVIESAASPEVPSFLLHALEDSRHKLPEVVLNVCEHFVAPCAAQARDIRTHHAGDEHSVGQLLAYRNAWKGFIR
jgi:hypothetical protein